VQVGCVFSQIVGYVSSALLVVLVEVEGYAHGCRECWLAFGVCGLYSHAVQIFGGMQSSLLRLPVCDVAQCGGGADMQRHLILFEL
jgi:hypothetical protein